MKTGRRKAKQNAWGNWNGYVGRRRVVEFGTCDVAAGYWVLTGVKSYSAGYASPELIQQCRNALTY